ncbi:MAG: RHS repeat-associated core domain-containing protein, partial [Blastocatellia bacterium]|nr:RHS repeat-associated core domain-containing protein [Blastocatellia bacterium]
KEVRSAPASGAQSRIEYSYDNPLTTGNLTTERSWDSTKGVISAPLDGNNSISVTHQYQAWSSGATGKPTSTVDANGNTSNYFYEDIGNGVTDLYVTKTETAANAAAIKRTTTFKYDYNSGLITETRDADNNVSTLTTYDFYGRPTLVREAANTSAERQTATEYSDSEQRVIVRSDLNTIGDGKLITIQHYDPWGRIRLTRKLESGDPSEATDESMGIKVQTRYFPGDAGNPNSYKLVSTPYRAATSGAAGGETGMGWKRTKFDQGGRVIEVETFAGAALPAPWGGNSASTGKVATEYDAEFVTVTDQAGKKRRSGTDALGRLSRITEDPGGLNYDTYYSYDALGNLLLVMQGAQTRTFIYNSLSRLTSATNPESGTIAYAYDPDGNLIEKTDDRGVKTTITYDALNRIKSKVYSGTTPEGTAAANVTPPVNFFYDDYSTLPSGAPTLSGTSSKGRLIGITYGGGSEGTYYTYDAAGRITTNNQRQGTSNYATSYTYNPAGEVTLEQRGNYLRNSWTYDNAGRISGMQKSFTPFLSFTDLATNIYYTPSGALQSETYGNGLIHSIGYNDRLQPTEIRLGRPDNLESVFTIYSMYGTASNVNAQDGEINLAQNNGNIARIRYSVSGTIQYAQTFQYDALNRLGYAVEHNNGTYNDAARAWYQTFDYDRYGNRGINLANTSDNVDGANSALQLSDFSGANNRITHDGYAYDASGNLIAEPGKSYTYDGENRLVTATLGATSQYLYDGNGRRVKKIVGGVATRFEYGASGELIAERNDTTGAVTKGYCYKGGELIATTTNGSSYEYATADHLGSVRAWTDGSGNLVAGGRHDYLPFGEELFASYGTRTIDQGYGASTQEDCQRKPFTGKERDSESGLDNFGARYFGSSLGRFMTPDWAAKPTAVPYAVFGDPQSLNLYSYVRNNPLSKADPDGHCSSPKVGKGEVGVCIDLYIQAKRINVVGLGDNRGPAANDPKATYRVELQLVADPKKGTVSVVKDDAGESKALGGLISKKGTSTTSPIAPTTDDKGITHFTVNNTALNGLHDLPGAPKDSIKTTIKMDVTSQGKVGIEGGMRTAYPSLEIYSYDSSGKATTILQIKEHDPSDLARQDQPIPKVAPQ